MTSRHGHLWLHLGAERKEIGTGKRRAAADAADAAACRSLSFLLSAFTVAARSEGAPASSFKSPAFFRPLRASDCVVLVTSPQQPPTFSLPKPT